MATLEEITDRFRVAASAGAPLDTSLKFNLKADGVILIEQGCVSNEDRPADLTITTKKADLEALGAGRLDPISAIMSGRLRLSDTKLAMRIQPKLQALFDKLR